MGGQGLDLQLDLKFKLPPAAIAKPLRVSDLPRNLFKPKSGRESPQSLRHRRWATILGALGTSWPKPRTLSCVDLGFANVDDGRPPLGSNRSAMH